MEKTFYKSASKLGSCGVCHHFTDELSKDNSNTCQATKRKTNKKRKKENSTIISVLLYFPSCHGDKLPTICLFSLVELEVLWRIYCSVHSHLSWKHVFSRHYCYQPHQTWDFYNIITAKSPSCGCVIRPLDNLLCNHITILTISLYCRILWESYERFRKAQASMTSTGLQCANAVNSNSPSDMTLIP